MPTTTEIGTVNSQSDADWASISVMQTLTPTYDSYRRKIVDRVSASGTIYGGCNVARDHAPERTGLTQRAHGGLKNSGSVGIAELVINGPIRAVGA